MASRTMAAATRKFRGSLGEVSVEEDALLTGMTLLARELDTKWNSTAYREWRITMNQIREGRGVEAGEPDPLEEFLGS